MFLPRSVKAHFERYTRVRFTSKPHA